MKRNYILLVALLFVFSFILNAEEKRLSNNLLYPEIKRTVYAPPACERNLITGKWLDRAMISSAIPSSPKGGMTLWYKAPAAIWEAALPIGNGTLGAMVFGGVADERIQLNESSLWDGFPLDSTNPEGLKALPEVRKLLFEGKPNEAEKIANQKLMGNPRGVRPYQSLGELWMESSESEAVTDYQRSLNLETAVATVQYKSNGVTFKREIFSSAPAEVIVMRIHADKAGSLNLKMILKRQQDAVCTAVDGDSQSIQLIGQVNRQDKEGIQRGLKFSAKVTALNEGGTVSNKNGVLQIKKADAVTILLSGATSYPGLKKMGELLEKDISGKNYNPAAYPNPIEICHARILKDSKIPYEQLKSDHIKDYQTYFKRVSIALGTADPEIEKIPTDKRLLRLKEKGASDPSLTALYFQFGRYLLISSSRPGGLPANLQGIWNWQMDPPWNSDYHTNINLQMNYWHVETANLTECHRPLFDYIDLLMKQGKQVAKVHYGSHGWVVHHLSDLWGFATPADGVWGFSPLGAAWLTSHVWEHYAFTGDKVFLKERGWPQLKGAGQFIIDYLIEAPEGTPVQGKLVPNPSVSPENSYIYAPGKSAVLTYASTMDLMIARDTLILCINASKVLNIDEVFRKECEKTLDRLAPIKISPKSGQIMEWVEDYQELDPIHRHISHLFGLHPSNIINPETPELFEAARKSLLRRGDESTGWALALRMNMWIRLLDGDHALILLKNLLRDLTYPNLFDSHPPFQIDGNFGATAGIAEMLLQSHNQGSKGLYRLQLLPALPSEWSEGSISGLRARGGVTVGLKWKNSKLTEVRFVSDQESSFKVEYNKIVKEIVLQKGKPLILNGDLN